MKLITKQDIVQGERYPSNVAIAYGRSTMPYSVSDCETLAEWEKVEGTLKNDGWYLKIAIPFTRTMLYIDTNTFEQKEGPCSYTILFRYRPANAHRDSIKKLIRGWFPV